MPYPTVLHLGEPRAALLVHQLVLVYLSIIVPQLDQTYEKHDDDTAPQNLEHPESVSRLFLATVRICPGSKRHLQTSFVAIAASAQRRKSWLEQPSFRSLPQARLIQVRATTELRDLTRQRCWKRDILPGEYAVTRWDFERRWQRLEG
jgi:hypothetical protein